MRTRGCEPFFCIESGPFLYKLYNIALLSRLDWMCGSERCADRSTPSRETQYPLPKSLFQIHIRVCCRVPTLGYDSRHRIGDPWWARCATAASVPLYHHCVCVPLNSNQKNKTPIGSSGPSTGDDSRQISAPKRFYFNSPCLWRCASVRRTGDDSGVSFGDHNFATVRNLWRFIGQMLQESILSLVTFGSWSFDGSWRSAALICRFYLEWSLNFFWTLTFVGKILKCRNL